MRVSDIRAGDLLQAVAAGGGFLMARVLCVVRTFHYAQTKVIAIPGGAVLTANYPVLVRTFQRYGMTLLCRLSRIERMRVRASANFDDFLSLSLRASIKVRHLQAALKSTDGLGVGLTKSTK